MSMHIAHHPIFVVLSMVIACLGSWTALDLFRRVRAHAAPVSMGWLLAAAVAMGLSIWSMHFIAMLGFSPGVEVRYNVGVTLLSLVLAIAVTAFAFFFASEQQRSRLILGGIVMGAGICLMHYIGMAALITPVRLYHEPGFVVLAFLVAVTASIGALIAALRERSFMQRAVAALILGAAIAGMHYTAMFGVRLSPDPNLSAVVSGLDTLALASAVTAGTVFILFLALISALFDRRFDALASQEALRSEQQLRAVIEHLPLGVFVVAAPSGEIRFANVEAEKLLGHPLGEAPFWAHDGTHGAVHADGAYLAAEEHAIYQAMKENRRVGPRLQIYRRGDGQLATFEVMAAPIRDVNGVRIVVTFQDVTMKLRAEKEAHQSAALRNSEERFRLIAEQAPVMLWMTDAQGRHIYLNKALRDFWGAPEDISNFDWSSTLLVEDRENFFAGIEAARREHRDFSIEARLRRVDGAARIVHTTSRVRFNDGEYMGMIGVNVDVTEARQAQTDLLHIKELLEERVTAALAEKDKAEAALVHAQRLEAMGRLTGGVAHDFNNLLTVVIGALDIILRHPENAERRTKLGEAALAAARRGERLTAQLLAFARRQPLRPETCDLNRLILESEPLFRGAVGDARLLDLQLSDAPAVARIDPAQFESSLLNLVVNAVDATAAGGHISLHTGIEEVAAAEFPDLVAGRYFVLCVADTGQGMSAEVQSRIFEPFFTTKAPGKGTGLGLSQVYGFVRQSGGAVRVRSAEGQGTRFMVYLPVVERQAAQIPPPQPPQQRPERGLRVLLAEDDAAVARITETMLKDLGHAVQRVESAEGALQVLRSAQPVDLLLSDVIMPGGLNGVELARQAQVLRPGLKILLSSGYAGESIEKELTEAAWPFLKKPYLEEELAAHLRQFATE